MKDEWIDGVPKYIDAEFEIVLHNGETRQCKRVVTVDYATLFFTDCTHPAQNAYCSDQFIKKWRVKT